MKQSFFEFDGVFFDKTKIEAVTWNDSPKQIHIYLTSGSRVDLDIGGVGCIRIFAKEFYKAMQEK